MFSLENTSGFTKAELSVCEQVYLRLTQNIPTLDPKSANDMIANAWQPGDDTNSLHARIRAQYPALYPKPVVPNDYDVAYEIMAYEQDNLSNEEILILFQHLVNTGLAWQLQGHYGRTARSLINAGYVFSKE